MKLELGALLLVLLLVLAGGCVSDAPPRLDGSSGATSAPLPWDESNQRPGLEVVGGRFGGPAETALELPAGPSTVMIRNRVEGADVGHDGQDLSIHAVGLWLHGLGHRRPLLPQFQLGPVNAGVQEDWELDLKPGLYVLRLTQGGTGEIEVHVGARGPLR